MNIEDEIKQAARDVLLDGLYSFTLFCWKRAPDMKMHSVRDRFCDSNGVTNEDAEAHRSMPSGKHAWMLWCTVTRYLALVYPKTSNAMFDGLPVALCEKIMRREKPAFGMTDYKTAKEKRLFDRTTAQADAASQSAGLVSNQRDNSSRSNWANCK